MFTASSASRMDVPDSLRYREAVARLRHLLYDETPQEELSSPHHQHHTARGDGGGAWRWLLELLRHQENLITQLEKENEFLKSEVVSVGDGLKKLAEDNQVLHCRLSNTLTQALEDGGLESISTSPAPGSITPTTALLRQKEALQEEVTHMEKALAAVSQREKEALTRLSHALALAEHTHAHTSQVRASSESALEQLSTDLTAAQREAGRLRAQLDETEARRVRETGTRERQAREAESKIGALRAEREEQEHRLTQLREEGREEGRKVIDLEYEIQTAGETRRRLEDQLEEQRRHAIDATTRLDQILQTRSGEAAAGAARAKDLEERLDAAREDTARLLQAVTALAKGGGRVGEAHSTDDVKSERLAAGQELQEALEALHSRHEAEVEGVQTAAKHQSEATDALRQELVALRKQLARDNETHRIRLEEMGRGLAALTGEATVSTDAVGLDSTMTTTTTTTSTTTTEPTTITNTIPADTTLSTTSAASSTIPTASTTTPIPSTTTTTTPSSSTITDNVEKTEQDGKEEPDDDDDKDNDDDNDNDNEEDEEKEDKAMEEDKNEDKEISDETFKNEDKTNETKGEKNNDNGQDKEDNKETKEENEPGNKEEKEEKEKVEDKEEEKEEKEEGKTGNEMEDESKKNKKDEEGNDIKSDIHTKQIKHDDEEEETKVVKEEEKQEEKVAGNDEEIHPNKEESKTKEGEKRDSAESGKEKDGVKEEKEKDETEESDKEQNDKDNEEKENKEGSHAESNKTQNGQNDKETNGETEKQSTEKENKNEEQTQENGLIQTEEELPTDPETETEQDEAKVKHETEENIEEPQCERCNSYAALLKIVGEGITDVQLEVNKQNTRLDRLSGRYIGSVGGCQDCLSYRMLLWATSVRLDSVDKYSSMLHNKIEALSQRVLSY